MVLDSVTVDCSEHVLSWSVDGGNKDSNEIALDDGNRPGRGTLAGILHHQHAHWANLLELARCKALGQR